MSSGSRVTASFGQPSLKNLAPEHSNIFPEISNDIIFMKMHAVKNSPFNVDARSMLKDVIYFLFSK